MFAHYGRSIHSLSLFTFDLQSNGFFLLLRHFEGVDSWFLALWIKLTTFTELTRVHVLFWVLLGKCFIKSSFWFKFKRTYLPVEFMSSLSFISRWKCEVWKLRLTTCVLQVRSSAVTTWILFTLQKISALTDQHVYSVLMSVSLKEVFPRISNQGSFFLTTVRQFASFVSK